jgi:hypothetical protein
VWYPRERAFENFAETTESAGKGGVTPARGNMKTKLHARANEILQDYENENHVIFRDQKEAIKLIVYILDKIDDTKDHLQYQLKLMLNSAKSED